MFIFILITFNLNPQENKYYVGHWGQQKQAVKTFSFTNTQRSERNIKKTTRKYQ